MSSSPSPSLPSYTSPSSIPSSEVDSLLSTLSTRFQAAGQGHVTSFVSELSEEQKKELCFDLLQIRVEQVVVDFEEVQKQSQAAASATPASITPFTQVAVLADIPAEEAKRWRETGLQLIAEGKVAALLMAGGQGTRLGSSEPKGCFDIQLLSHKSLFQLQAERLQRLRQLAAAHAGLPVSSVHLRWYIMTSLMTHEATLAYFRHHEFFGLPQEDLFFFQQSELPALDHQGKIILENKHKAAMAPNGNGGIFEGLHRRGALEDMKKHDISYIHVYGVDNVLAKVGDPTFIGFAVEQKADCANKVVLKTDPSEKVGVMCLRDGRPSVVEYSELPQHMSVLRSEETGQLLYSAGNIVQHFFTFDFLQQHALAPLMYHVAHKAIPCVDASGAPLRPKEPNGLKLEMFVFDAFERSTNMLCLAVKREEEFSPVKNAEGPGVKDSPATARQALSDLHCKLLQEAGATINNKRTQTDDQQLVCECEISPLLSYSGEGLSALVAGKTIPLPFHLTSESLSQLQPAGGAGEEQMQ